MKLKHVLGLPLGKQSSLVMSLRRKTKFFIKDFFSKCGQILNEKLHDAVCHHLNLMTFPEKVSWSKNYTVVG